VPLRDLEAFPATVVVIVIFKLLKRRSKGQARIMLSLPVDLLEFWLSTGTNREAGLLGNWLYI